MPIQPATKEQMVKQGFPEEFQTAFKQTAEETQCVILSRVPGDTTALIADGHDLKGFLSKPSRATGAYVGFPYPQAGAWADEDLQRRQTP